MWLIVGLGNPGQEHRLSRHNVGFLVLDWIAEEHGAVLIFEKYYSLWGRVWIRDQEVFLVKPRTYMNRSGVCVREWVSSLEIPVSRLVIVHDDLDLSLGRIRIKKGGGDGGHRGIRSIMRELGSGDFLRLKVGIGRPPLKVSSVDYVLEPFYEPEEVKVREVIKKASEGVETLIGEGPEVAMNRFNIRQSVNGNSNLKKEAKACQNMRRL